MRRGAIIGIVVAGLCLGLGASVPDPLAAQRPAIPSEAGDSFPEQRRALLAARRQATIARARSERLEAQAKQATQDADRASRWVAALAARIQESEADIQAASARVALVARLQRIQNARLAERQQPIVRLTAALQMLARRPTALALVQPGSISDAVHMRAVLATIQPVIRARTADLRQELVRSRQLRQAAELAEKSLRDGRTRLATQQADLRKLEASKRLASRDYASGATLEADRALAMGERARDIVDLMDRLEVAGDVRARLETLDGPVLRPADPTRAAMPAADRQAVAGGRIAYRLPVVGTLVTGMGEISDSGVRARGITVATQPGAQIVAPSAGRVAFADHYRGYGRIVILDHGKGWTTLITGLNRLSVGVGVTVAQGDPLGTAAPASPSVTVELRQNGKPVDILPMAGLG